MRDKSTEVIRITKAVVGILLIRLGDVMEMRELGEPVILLQVSSWNLH